MKRFVRLASVVLGAAVVFLSCSKDKPSGSLEFDAPAIFVEPGEQVTVDFKASNNISPNSYSVTSRPVDWDEPLIDAEAHTMTFKVPDQTEFEDGAARKGTFVLTAAPAEGQVASATLFVAVAENADLGAPANSYIVSKGNTRYAFDAMHKGDGTSALATASLAIIWQSRTSLLQYLSLEEGKGVFFVSAEDSGFIKGNAVIGAYNSNGTLIWSWHIWVTDFEIGVIPATKLMNCNLGALNNSNKTESDIQESYGLYYQWGRKDPFVGPAAYNASSNTDVAMYTQTNSRVYLKFEESTESTGTVEYAVQHPMSFLTATEKSGHDWLYAAHSNVLWSDQKTVNDPCPAGWRVASSTSFDVLSLENDPLAREKYSAELTSGGADKYLFFGVGRRSYLNGSIQNYYFPDASPRSAREDEQVGLPWLALYWTTGTQVDNSSSALYFHYGATTFDTAHKMYRANAMPVRCVKMD